MAVDRSACVLGPIGGRPVVLLHGLTGCPWDLLPLGETLAASGYRVHIPLLAGHHSVEALAASRWTDWYDAAEAALLAAHDSRRPPLLVGFSMGSLLALRLAALHGDALAALVAMSVPIEHPRWQLQAAGLIAWLRGRSPWLAASIGHRRKAPSDVRRKAVVDRRAALPALPYSTIVEFGRLQASARALLPRITTPTLLLHGAYDHVAPVDGSARVSQMLASEHVRRVVLPLSFHHLARDVERERVGDEILSFAARFVPTQAHSAASNSASAGTKLRPTYPLASSRPSARADSGSRNSRQAW